jgi:hypothetical protein
MEDIMSFEQAIKAGAVAAKGDGVWLVYLDKNRNEVGMRKIGSVKYASDEARLFNQECRMEAVNVRA